MGVVPVLLWAVTATLLPPSAWGACLSSRYVPWSPSHTACIDASPKAVPTPITDAIRQELLDGHNSRRASVTPPPTAMPKMTWDHDLEALAQKWADSCQFAHDENIDRFIPGRFTVGQNLYFGWGSGTNHWNSAVSLWWNEVNDYVFDKPISEQNFGKVGHFTQMAWDATYQLGCAAAKCDQYHHVVCNYGPAGNVGDFSSPYAYESNAESTRGSGCASNNGGLCDCGEISCNMGTLKTDTCTCDCGGNSYLKGDNCYLDCTEGTEWQYCSFGFNVATCRDTWLVMKCPHSCPVCPEGGGDPDATPAPPTTTSAPPPVTTTSAPPPVTTTSAPPPVTTTPHPTTTTSAPPPVTTTSAPPPVTTTSAPPPVTTTSAPPPVTTTSAPPPVTTTNAPPHVTTTSAPPPVTTTSAPPPVTTTSAPPPVTTTNAPPPVTTTSAPPPVTTTSAPPPVTTTSAPPLVTTTPSTVTTTSAPPPTTTTSAPPPTTTTSAPPPVTTTSAPPPVTTTSAPPPVTTTPSPVTTTSAPPPVTTTPPPVTTTSAPQPVTTTRAPPPVTTMPSPTTTTSAPPPVTTTSAPPPVTTTPPPVTTTSAPPPVTTTRAPPPVTTTSSPPPVYTTPPPVTTTSAPPPVTTTSAPPPVITTPPPTTTTRTPPPVTTTQTPVTTTIAPPPVTTTPPPTTTSAPPPVTTSQPPTTTVPPTTAPVRCPRGGWTLLPATTSGQTPLCFLLLKGKRTYEKAASKCTAKGGSLLSIKSNQTRSQLKDVVSGKVSAWVGLSRADKDAPYLWEDGTAVTWDAFVRKAPKANQHCAHTLLHPGGAGPWKPLHCAARRRAACLATPTPSTSGRGGLVLARGANKTL